MNEQGNTTLFAMALLLIVSTVALLSLKQRLDYLKKTTATQQTTLCAKKYNGETKHYISFMQKTNQALKFLTLTQRAQVAIPIYGVAVKVSVAKAKQLIKITQNLKFISYVNKLGRLNSRFCLLSPSTYKTPYTYSIGTGFIRNHWDEAKIRSKKWKNRIFGKNIIIKNTAQIGKEVKFTSNYLKLEMP